MCTLINKLAYCQISISSLPAGCLFGLREHRKKKVNEKHSECMNASRLRKKEYTRIKRRERNKG